MSKELLFLIFFSLLLIQCRTNKKLVKETNNEIIGIKKYTIGNVYEAFIHGDYSKIYKSEGIGIILGLTKKGNFKKAIIIYNYVIDVQVEEGKYEFRDNILITETEHTSSNIHNKELPIYNSYKYDNIKFQLIDDNEILLRLIDKKELEKEYSAMKSEHEELLKEFE